MGLVLSPSIITNGLVLCIDMGNSKSFKGRPVTNQFTLPSSDVNGFGVQNSTFTRVRSGTYGGYTIQPTDYVWQYNINGSDCPYHGWDIPTTAGDVVTFSFDFYISPTTVGYPSTNFLAAFENQGSGTSGSIGDPSPSTIGVWKRIYFNSTATATGNSRCLLYPGACGPQLATGTGFILYKNPQVEFNAPGGIPTPFVAGTRSNTQAIVDLTGNSTATVNSLTYASNGTFSFTGASNNNITVSVSNVSTNDISRSWEAWVMPTTSQTTAGLFGHVLSGGCTYYCNGGVCIASSNYQFNWYDNTNYQFLDSGVAATSNVPVHVVGTYDSFDTKCRIYINGVLKNTSSATNMSYGGAANLIQIGYLSASGNYFTGNINSIKHYYTKALTADEIKQNFNALRGRYGI